MYDKSKERMVLTQLTEVEMVPVSTLLCPLGPL